MVLFQMPNGSTTEAPDNIDPKTGENTTINQVLKESPELQVVHEMIDPSNPKQSIIVPQNSIMHAIQGGLVTPEQFKNQQLSEQSKQKVLSGDIGYTPSKTETFYSKFANSALGNELPAIEGIGNAIAHPTDISNAYNSGKEASQGVLAAEQKAHPIVSDIASPLGYAAATAPLMGGGLIKNLATQGAFGALSSAGADYSKEQTQNLGRDIGEGGIIGMASVLAGGTANKILGAGANLVSKAFITPEAKQAFRLAANGANLNDPAINKSIQDASATYGNVVADRFNQIKQVVGSQLGDLINAKDAMGGIDAAPIKESINSNINHINDLLSKTADEDERSALLSAKTILANQEKTLNLQPDTAAGIQKVKQTLAQHMKVVNPSAFSDNPQPINPFLRDAYKSLGSVRDDAQHYLEDNIEQARNTNQGYKTLSNIFDKADAIPSSTEMKSIGTGNPSPTARVTLINLQNALHDLKGNPQIPDSMREDTNSILSDVLDVASKGRTANVVQQSHGLNPLSPNAQAPIAASIGNNINQFINQPGIKTITNAATPVFQGANNLNNSLISQMPQSIQNYLAQNPSGLPMLLKSLAPAASAQPLQNRQGDNNGQ